VIEIMACAEIIPSIRVRKEEIHQYDMALELSKPDISKLRETHLSSCLAIKMRNTMNIAKNTTYRNETCIANPHFF